MMDRLLTTKSRPSSHLLKFQSIILIVFTFLFFLYPLASSADINLSISATVIDTSGGGGGGGGIGVSLGAPTDITFSGIAYPNAKIILLLDGSEVSETVASINGSFVVKLSNLTAGTNVFSIAAEDQSGVRSILVTLPIIIADKTSTLISNLFIPPTFSIVKTSYGVGGSMTVKGYSYPGASVIASIDDQDVVNGIAGVSGAYNFNINTSTLSLGDHTIDVRAQTTAGTVVKTSGLGRLTHFSLGANSEEVSNQGIAPLFGDINGDGVVNIIDFSILASWYGKQIPPKNVDLDSDGQITIKDFSILAYYWNG